MLQHRFLRLITISAVYIGISLIPHALYAATPTAEQYRQAINQQRQQFKRSPLTTSYTLNRAALRRVQSMAREHYFAHTSPNGVTHTTFLAAGPAKFSRSGEILGRNFLSPTSAIQAWLASPSHAAQIKSTTYTHIGAAVGTIRIKNKPSTVVVVLFGRAQ
jgi:uncharacterized protein YkwD